MKTVVSTCLIVSMIMLMAAGCSTTPQSASGKMELDAKAIQAIDQAKQTDPTLDAFFKSSVGYAVFPTVGKGAVGVGAAYGRGELFQNGIVVGYCTLTQASIGLALGGQAYTELIFFENDAALNQFKSGELAFAAQVSAVALESGASANAKYSNGVAVFTMSEAGLMYEASVGGQKFSYEPAM